ncbi:MAG: hypothetical protein HYY85_07295 [Deltaproteobacteria bacterium]|nr:hypothetical protein [Deltaproteobacteria bacterium]
MRRIPDQLIRLAVPFVVIVAALVVAKAALTPPTFGRYGHYRASAVDEIAAQPIRYAGQQACANCHEEVGNKKAASYHRGVSCEVCHGAARAHTESPGEHKPPKPKERGFCPLCHSFNPSRPTGFPQISPITHNPGKPCISCHNPHDPTPPRVPRACGACHGDIERTKLLSPHVNLPCTRCHDTPQKHRVTPRLAQPSKPATREFCGGCHAKEATSPPDIPRVDLRTHGERYVCWDCHYPHFPKAYAGAAK